MRWYSEPFTEKRGMRSMVFSGASLDSIHEGNKTQTRRVLPMRLIELAQYNERDALARAVYQPGDRCWAREVYQLAPNGITVLYKRDYDLVDGQWRRRDSGQLAPGPWKSPRFMPKLAARTQILVLQTGIQQVRDISEADALAEGYAPEPAHDTWCDGCHRPVTGADVHWSSVKPFSAAWDGLNEKRGFGWVANPYVLACQIQEVEWS